MNNTIKKFSLISMAFVLCICCIVPSFSWYSHSAVQNDKTAMYYKRNDLPVSGYLASDNLSMTTYKGSIDDQGEVSYETTPLGDNEQITAQISKETCYKTVIENKSAQDIRTGLYLETANFGNNDIYFGTSDPIWRRLSADSMSTVAKPKIASTNTMRVYFKRTYNDDGSPVWSETEFYVSARSDGYNSNVYKMTNFTYNEDSDYYYADIPADTVDFYIACEEKESLDFRRTGNIPVEKTGEYKLSPTQSVLVTLPSGLDENGNMQYKVEKIIGANVANYVSTLFLTTRGNGNTGSVALKKGTDYIGYDTETVSGITYTSEKPSIATVDRKTGTVTGVAEGTAVIDITVKGQYGDTYTVKSVVNVQNPNQTVPLVQNILVPKKDGDNNGTATVCWYIDNKSTTTDLDDIKLMLTL